MAFNVPEKYRVKQPKGMPLRYASDAGYGNNGVFRVTSTKLKNPLNVIAGDGDGWEHVSVSMPHRCPSWGEMCHVKNLFWDPSDCVVQYHPPEKDWVNNHSYCLHLWRPKGPQVPTPPQFMVGDPALGVLI